MVLGVMSDTHGNTVLMRRAASVMTDVLGATLIIHLGDDYADADELEMYGYTVRAVPGLWCREYHDRSIARTRIETIDGWVFGYAHAEQDLARVDGKAQVLLMGHTHEPGIVFSGRVLRVNPGHLRSSRSRRHAPSFGIITTTSEKILVSLHNVDGTVRETAAFLRKAFSA